MFINVTQVKLLPDNGTSTSHVLEDFLNSLTLKRTRKVFRDGAER